MNRILIGLLGLLVLGGCGFYNEKNPGDPNSINVNNVVSFAQVSARVFQPRCAICHSVGGAGFNSSDYSAVVSKISQVQERAINKQDMPADSPLTPYETKLLTTWISQGTPQ
jgi:uncharacterized membrane protein